MMLNWRKKKLHANQPLAVSLSLTSANSDLRKTTIEPATITTEQARKTKWKRKFRRNILPIYRAVAAYSQYKRVNVINELTPVISNETT